MAGKRLKSLKERVAYRVVRSKLNVFVREDFADLGGYDQIGRALRELVGKQRLIKIGYGLYARAQTSPLSGRVIPAKTLSTLAKEALGRLGIAVSPSSFVQAYNNGLSTQGRQAGSLPLKGGFHEKSAMMGNISVLNTSVLDPNLIEAIAIDLGVDESFVEKDWHTMQLLSCLQHVEDQQFQLVFSGGTSLSKAYQLIERFSEDLDFKILLPASGCSRSQLTVPIARK